MKSSKFSISNRIKSFNHAFNGLKVLWKEEHNARIHFFFIFLVVGAGLIFKITLTEWISLVFAMGLVVIVEIINSSIENLADFISPSIHLQIKKIKDLSAAAVLTSAITALIIGLIIFVPRIMAVI
jgi:undecaprenol kinase/diacylglycerol kinase (ATP)